MPRPAERVLSSGVKALHSNIPAQPHLERSNTAQGAQDGEGMQAEASGSYTHAGFDPEVEGLAEEWSEASSKGRSAGGSEGGKKNKASPPASTKPMSVLDAALQAFKEEQRMLNKVGRGPYLHVCLHAAHKHAIFLRCTRHLGTCTTTLYEGVLKCKHVDTLTPVGNAQDLECKRTHPQLPIYTHHLFHPSPCACNTAVTIAHPRVCVLATLQSQPPTPTAYVCLSEWSAHSCMY
eukprot:scaffold292967_cov26-Tisochrysis_lutea.AAC.1